MYLKSKFLLILVIGWCTQQVLFSPELLTLAICSNNN